VPTGHQFISYSGFDGLELASRIAAELESGAPAFPVWFDKLEKRRHRLRPGEQWPEEIDQGLQSCAGVLFLMTPDSVDPLSVCAPEVLRARRYKKPIIPLQGDAKIEKPPFILEGREVVSFRGAFEQAMSRLREHLAWVASPAGVLRQLEHQLADANRDLRRADDPLSQQRYRDEIDLLREQILAQREVVEAPDQVAGRVRERVVRGIEQERAPRPAPRTAARCRIVNASPGTVPRYFQDRHAETQRLARLIEDPAIRVCFVVGRGGVGKTTFVCRLLDAVAGVGAAPDDVEDLPDVQAIVSLSAAGTRRISLPNLFADLSSLAAGSRATELAALYASPQATTRTKMLELLAALPPGPVLVLLDNFEDVVDGERLSVRDTDLLDGLRAVLAAPAHAVKLIVTTRVAPRDLQLEQPGRQARIDLDDGLPSPYAENLLREKDADGKLGLASAPDALLSEVRRRTRGYPRALEALFAILSADRDASLASILSSTANLLPDEIMNVLIGEAFSLLDAGAQSVIQALAVFDRPVAPEAIDAVLAPHLPREAAGSVLRRLVNMELARKESGRYYLHPVDRAYAIGRLPRGTAADRDPTAAAFTQLAFLSRGAAYFQQARKDPASWDSLDDLAAPLVEIELRMAGDEHDAAYRVLCSIDPYLVQWGHYRMSLDLHRRLEGKIADPVLRVRNLEPLAWMESRLGQYRQAIVHCRQILDEKDALDSTSAVRALYRLGWCYCELGDISEAITYGRAALDAAMGNGLRAAAASSMSLLGWYYGKLGATERAIDFCERAVVLARALDGVNTKAKTLALEWPRTPLATSLCNLAGVLLDVERWKDAISAAKESLESDKERSDVRNWSNGFLARAYLATGDLVRAREAAEAARAADEPENLPNVLVLLGIVRLRQGEKQEAADAFRAAVDKADALIQFAPNHNCLDAKGLGLAGLSLCDGTGSAAAAECHRAARELNSDQGVVRRVRWLYRALAPCDPAGLLDAARA